MLQRQLLFLVACVLGGLWHWFVRLAGILGMYLFVVRHPQTKLYRHADGSWVTSWQQAQEFRFIMAAVQRCIEADLPDYEIVQKDPSDPGPEIVLVRQSSGLGPRKAKPDGI